jgi:hypothetical protein
VIWPFYGDGSGSAFVPPATVSEPIEGSVRNGEIRMNYGIDKFISVSDAATNSMRINTK